MIGITAITKDTKATKVIVRGINEPCAWICAIIVIAYKPNVANHAAANILANIYKLLCGNWEPRLYHIINNLSVGCNFVLCIGCKALI